MEIKGYVLFKDFKNSSKVFKNSWGELMGRELLLETWIKMLEWK